ncbi:MAG: CorA family divalent cation transporter [Candidatus Doudnabacteria bacterium]
MSLKIIHTKNLRWVDIVNPDEKDLNYLKENFKFHPLDFDDIVVSATRTKIDEYDHYHFLVLLFPLLNRETGEIRPAEVDFFVGKDFLVTIHDGSMRTLNNLVHNVHQYDNSRISYLSAGPGYLLFSVLEILFKRSSPILDRINHDVNEAGKNIFQLDIQTLQKLSELKKNIIIYRRIMKMHAYVLVKLERSRKDYMQFKDSKGYFQGLIEYADNNWEVLSSDKESVESFEQTNQSLGTHKLNDIVQVLTVLSVIISVLALVTDILIFFERTNIEKNYGLSTDFQLFLFITTVLVVITTVMLSFFKSRKWL